MKHHGYGIDDFIPCEVCSKKATDIHHIETRKSRPDLAHDITNLMALCRQCHIDYGDKKAWKDFLKKKHLEHL